MYNTDMLIDTHGHVNFNAFKDDADEVIQRAFNNDTWIVMPGSQYSTSKRAAEMAERYKEGVYAAVGLHPIHLGDQREVDVMEVQSQEVEREDWMTFKTRQEKFDYEAYRRLVLNEWSELKEKVVAIGEVGLDYYRLPKSKAKRAELKEKQKEVLQQQINLALEHNLPVIFHCRAAFDDLINLILGTKYRIQNTGTLRGVIHSYTGTIEQAKQFLDLGFFIGFNGLIFKEVPALPDVGEVIACIPLERILLETDSPYLKPPMVEGERNEPIHVRYVAERIAKIKKVSLEEVAQQTTKNAKTLFRI